MNNERKTTLCILAACAGILLMGLSLQLQVNLLRTQLHTAAEQLSYLMSYEAQDAQHNSEQPPPP